jgi:hypothetical protein
MQKIINKDFPQGNLSIAEGYEYIKVPNGFVIRPKV